MNYNNMIQEREKILRELYQEAQNNDEIYPSHIHFKLLNYGLKKRLGDEIIKVYENIKKNYSSSKKINIDWDNWWNKYELNINSNIPAKMLDNKQIAINLNINPPYVEMVITQITDYLISKNIPFSSYMNMSRMEIYVPKKIDAINIINYINSTSYIKNNLVTPQPFSFQIGNISLSYYKNSIWPLCQVISYYINLSKQNNKQVSQTGFLKFIEVILNDNNYFNQMMQYLYKNKPNYTIDNENEYKDILKFYIISSKEEYNYQKFFNDYNKQYYDHQKCLKEAIIITTQHYNQEQAVTGMRAIVRLEKNNGFPQEVRPLLKNISSKNIIEILVNSFNIDNPLLLVNDSYLQEFCNQYVNIVLKEQAKEKIKKPSNK